MQRTFTALALIIWSGWSCATEEPVIVNVAWSDVGAILKTHVALQVCPEPPMFRGKPLHDPIFRALRDLKADYHRFQPWAPFPRLAVAELQAPADGKTYWDFTLMDQIVADFMQAADGHPVVFSINTIPEWMYEGGQGKQEVANQDAIDWSYGSKGKFSDAMVRKFADYEARVAGWYLKGGFTDDSGQWHASGHFYKNIEYWEPLNEPNNHFTPVQVTELYDAVATAVREVAPGMKFSGPSLMNNSPAEARVFDWNPRQTTEHFQYFLDPQHHQAGVPLDMLSYHFYTTSDLDETPAERAHTLFASADAFLMQAYMIDVLKQQSWPSAKTAISELGTQVRPFQSEHFSVPESYWNLTAAVWAYLYANLAALGVDVINGSELIDYPGNWAASTFIDWQTGRPKPVYRVLKLLQEQFHPGDQLVKPARDDQFMQQIIREASQLTPDRYLYYQGVKTAAGEKKILLINRSDKPLEVLIPGGALARISYVDLTTGSSPPREGRSESERLQLGGYAVAIVVLEK